MAPMAYRRGCRTPRRPQRSLATVEFLITVTVHKTAKVQVISSMRLFVQSGRQPHREAGEDVWILLENTWNDYAYRTLYNLYRQTAEGFRQMGGIKILRLGQQGGETTLPLGEVAGGRIPDTCISRGNGLELYVSLTTLGQAGSREKLIEFRDIAWTPEWAVPFAEERGLQLSLHRDESEPELFYADARAVIEAGGALPDLNRFAFGFAPGPDAEMIEFAFHPAARAPLVGEVGPSRRVMVFVGANGVGKTQLLARLARVAYTPPDERGDVTESGHFRDTPAFPGIVAVSYSAFDTFKPPALVGDNPQAVADQLRDGTGRYAYCGTRDLASSVLNPAAPPILLSALAQAELFAARIEQVRTSDRFVLLAQAVAPVFAEDSFRRLAPQPIGGLPQPPAARLDAFLGQNPAAAFLDLSSGHMIALHVLASLVATLKRRGLALIDEPETHLHPPLLAALMTGVRRVLDRLDAYGIIATHSPVVAQEVPASQVRVVEWGGAGPLIRPVGVQTFGENTGTLTREIFGLHTGATDYRHILDRLAGAFNSLEAIEDALGERLSTQATAHVVSVLARRPDAVG